MVQGTVSQRRLIQIFPTEVHKGNLDSDKNQNHPLPTPSIQSLRLKPVLFVNLVFQPLNI